MASKQKTKKNVVSFRCSKRQKDMILEAADIAGLPMATYARACTLSKILERTNENKEGNNEIRKR